MGIEDRKSQTPETQKDKNPESSIENINTAEALKKTAETHVAKIQNTGDKIITEGISLAKTSEERGIVDSTKKEVKKITDQAKDTFESALRGWQERPQVLQESLRGIDIHNPTQVAEWFQKNADEQVKEHSNFIMGFQIVEQMEELLLALQEAHGVDTDKNFQDLVDYSEETANEALSGDMSVLGRDVCSYSAHEDGFNGSIDKWNIQALQESMKEFLKEIEDAKK